jgi:hypothetical protein
MSFPGPSLLLASVALLAAATPVSTPEPAAAPSPNAPASDYTTQMSEPPLLPEYDPATAPPPMAEAPDEDGLRQCVGTDGVPIFTDRRCGDLGATDYVKPPGAYGSAPVQPLRVRTCARNQDDLLAGVRAALESHDANRLADYYHWTGMGSTEGYRLMDRLDAFASRPVVDVQLVRAAVPAAEEDPWGLAVPPLEAEPFFGPEGETEHEADPAPPPRRPRRLASMLRVDQMRSNDDVASTITYFHLLTNAGCWWMRF